VEHNLKASVRYDGTGFAGWQVQPGLRTVQGEIERALAQIAGDPVRLHGAGRTDAGVHALGQVFSFPWTREGDLAALRRSLARMLRPEILVTAIEDAPPDFEARRFARGKLYAYAIFPSRDADPFSVRYAWQLSPGTDVNRIAAICQRFVGTHDFAGLQCGGASVKTTIRKIHSITLYPGGLVGPCDAENLWRLEFHGEGFLYKMVRNIVGTAVDVARGNLPESRVDELLASCGPFHGHTAPACGLALVKVLY